MPFEPFYFKFDLSVRKTYNLLKCEFLLFLLQMLEHKSYFRILLGVKGANSSEHIGNEFLVYSCVLLILNTVRLKKVLEHQTKYRFPVYTDQSAKMIKCLNPDFSPAIMHLKHLIHIFSHRICIMHFTV
jgi:hypothetical protein